MAIASPRCNRSYVGMEPTPETLEFARTLASAMARARMSQSRLSELTGVAQTSISKMLRGEQRVYLDQAIAFARALDCSVDEVCGMRGGLSHDEETMVRAIRAARLDPADLLGKLLNPPQKHSPVPEPRNARGITAETTRRDDGQGQGQDEGPGRRSG